MARLLSLLLVALAPSQVPNPLLLLGPQHQGSLTRGWAWRGCPPRSPVSPFALARLSGSRRYTWFFGARFPCGPRTPGAVPWALTSQQERPALGRVCPGRRPCLMLAFELGRGGERSGARGGGGAPGTFSHLPGKDGSEDNDVADGRGSRTPRGAWCGAQPGACGGVTVPAPAGRPAAPACSLRRGFLQRLLRAGPCRLGSMCASAVPPARRQHGSGSGDRPAPRAGLRAWGRSPCGGLTCPAGTRKSSGVCVSQCSELVCAAF